MMTAPTARPSFPFHDHLSIGQTWLVEDMRRTLRDYEPLMVVRAASLGISAEQLAGYLARNPRQQEDAA